MVFICQWEARQTSQGIKEEEKEKERLIFVINLMSNAVFWKLQGKSTPLSWGALDH